MWDFSANQALANQAVKTGRQAPPARPQNYKLQAIAIAKIVNIKSLEYY